MAENCTEFSQFVNINILIKATTIMEISSRIRYTSLYIIKLFSSYLHFSLLYCTCLEFFIISIQVLYLNHNLYSMLSITTYPLWRDIRAKSTKQKSKRKPGVLEPTRRGWNWLENTKTKPIKGVTGSVKSTHLSLVDHHFRFG